MPIAEHIKRAMEINADKVTEFLKQCEDNDLNEIFFIDSLLIACANGAPNKKQVEFLAEIGDVMGFDKEKMDWLTKLAVSILEQDSDKYLEANLSYGPDYEESFLEALICYTKEYVSGRLISTSTHCHIYSKEIGTEPLDGGSRTWFDLDELIIENQYINDAMLFKCVKLVRIRNCAFNNLKDYSHVLNFIGVERVIIEHCHFSNTNAVFELDNQDCVLIVRDSQFINCIHNDCSTIVHSKPAPILKLPFIVQLI